MQCKWRDLGDVTGPGEYPVKGVGIVHVMQSDIDTARKLGGDPVLTLASTKAMADKITPYRITAITP